MKKTIPIYHVDAFTSEPFKGNPGAVAFLDKPASPEWMQNIAAEMNLSETAFIVPREDNGFDLRWFTPTVEIELCGHGTLLTAHALWESGKLNATQEARFHTLSGELIARKNNDFIEMDFPVIRNRNEQIPETAINAIGLSGKKFISSRGVRENDNYIVEVESESLVRSLQPDFKQLLDALQCGVIVTARSETSKFDFISRFFDPAYGIDEDPVTGSAHCMLAPYWSDKLNKNNLKAYQASSRGGEVNVRLNGDRVILSGKAVTVMVGHLIS